MRLLFSAALLIFASAATPSMAQSVCTDHPEGGALDFWVGAWRVTSPDGAVPYGDNKIEKALGGCAIFEHWASARGGEGKSLFSFNARSGDWEQLWVTPDTARPGGLKHKKLIEKFADGGVRFQGSYEGNKDNNIVDRTTLTPNDGGSVRQHIEISMDDGETWRTTFDALYTPAANAE